MADLLTPKRKQPVTAAEIRAAMLKRWATPEYAIMWEVSNATGASSKRYADAVIMSLWPSRGLELHGIEIKVSRSDWKREAADPRKAEAVGQFCDRWYVHTAPGVVDDLSSLPPAWGLREFDGKNWQTIREAEKNEPVPMTRSFLAAMLRRADGMMRAMIEEAKREGRDAVAAEAEEARKRFAEDVERAVERRTRVLAEATENVKRFEDAFGEGSANNWAIDYIRLGRAARALSVCGATGWSSFSSRLRKAADEIDTITSLIDPPKEQQEA